MNKKFWVEWNYKVIWSSRGKKLVHKHVESVDNKEPIKRSIFKEELIDKSIRAEEGRAGAGCGDHTYKTYDRRVWSSCVPLALSSLQAFSSPSSPGIPATHHRRQSDFHLCSRRGAVGPMRCDLKQKFYTLLYYIQKSNICS